VYSDTSTLLDTFELRGKWWLADRPHDRVLFASKYKLVLPAEELDRERALLADQKRLARP
jgi:hypothetical protein